MLALGAFKIRPGVHLPAVQKDPTPSAMCASTMLTPGDPCLFLTPWNWLVRDSEAVSSSVGAYLKAAWTGGIDAAQGTVSLHIGSSLDPNVSARKPRLYSNGIPASEGTILPLAGAGQLTLGYSIDEGPLKTVEILLSEESTIVKLPFKNAPGLVPLSTHSVVVKILAISMELDRWGTREWQPQTSLRLQKIVLPSGARAVQPTLRARRAIFFGDSITEGFTTRSCNMSTLLASNGAHRYWVTAVASAIDAEYSIIAFGNTGWTAPLTAEDGSMPLAIGNMPPFSTGETNTWSLHWAGTPRLPGDSTPDVIVVNHGVNDVVLTGGLDGKFPYYKTIPPEIAVGVTAGVGQWARGMRTLFGPKPLLFAAKPFGGGFPSEAWIESGAARYHEETKQTDTVHLVEAVTVGGLGYSRTKATAEIQYGLFPTPIAGVFDASCDGLHPVSWASMELGARVAASIARQLN